MQRNFSSAGLVRLLRESTLVEVDIPRQDVAERLSQWLGAFDAVKLHAVHQAMVLAGAVPAKDARWPDLPAVQAHFQRVHEALVRAISAPDRLPAPGGDGDYAPYRQWYLELQRQMDLKITPLRAQIRQIVSQGPARLRQLAMLDAALEQMLQEREQKLLSAVPQLLKRRFEQGPPGHTQPPAQAPQPAGTPAGGDAFCQELQATLLAELNVRLQPVMGLIDALRNEAKREE